MRRPIPEKIHRSSSFSELSDLWIPAHHWTVLFLLNEIQNSFLELCEFYDLRYHFITLYTPIFDLLDSWKLIIMDSFESIAF